MSLGIIPSEVLVQVLISQNDSTSLVIERRVCSLWKKLIEKTLESYWMSEIKKTFVFSEEEIKSLLDEMGTWFRLFMHIKTNFEISCSINPISTVPIRCIPTNFIFRNPFPFPIYLAYFKDFDKGASTSEWNIQGNTLSVKSATSNMVTHVLMLDCFEIRSSAGYPMTKKVLLDKDEVPTSSIFQLVIGNSFDILVVAPLGELSFEDFPFPFQDEQIPDSVEFLLLRDMSVIPYDSDYLSLEKVFPRITRNEIGHKCHLVNPRRGNYQYKAFSEVFARVLANISVKLHPRTST